MQCLFSDHNRIKLEMNNRKIVGKSQSIWRFNNTLLNSTWVEKEISRGILKHFGLNENETTIYQNVWEVAKVAEKAMAPHSSVLAWRIPGTGRPDRLPSMGSHRVGHD